MEKYKDYIADNIILILEEIKSLENMDNDDFLKGQKTAYYNIITILKEQAKLFDIDLKEINLDLFNEVDFWTE